jgi:hypothetical protein
LEIKPSKRVIARLSIFPTNIENVVSRSVLLLCSLFIGGSLTILNIAGAWKANASRKWPTVDGVINSSKIIAGTSKDSKGNERAIHKVEVNYSYEVGSVKYNGSRISYSGSAEYSNLGEAFNLRSQYEPKSIVKVFYDPKNLQDSVLVPGVTYRTHLGLAGGLLFLFLGPLIAIYGRLRRRSIAG